MSFVSEREQKLILDLVGQKITESAFCSTFPLVAGTASTAGLSMLQRALEERDAVGVDFGTILAEQFGLAPEYLQVLADLASAPWHQRHEDIVRELALLKSPLSIEPLYQAAQARYEYSYDDGAAIARKAVHALGDILTVESVSRLGDLLRDRRQIVQNYARKELTKIAAREHGPEAVRAEATRALARET